jgi:hypothetical protein
MVTVDWLNRILDKSLGRTSPPGKAGQPPATALSHRGPLPVRNMPVWECPHCHSRITDFDLETG